MCRYGRGTCPPAFGPALPRSATAARRHPSSAGGEPLVGSPHGARRRGAVRRPTRRRCEPGTRSWTSGGSEPQGLRGRAGRGHRGRLRSLFAARRADAASTSAAASARRLSGSPSSSGAGGFVLGTDSSPQFIEDARREAAEAGVENVEFEVADAQTAQWDPIYDYAFSRMGTQFFAAPVPAMRAIRGALSPAAGCASLLAPQERAPVLGGDREVVAALPLAPDEYEADTCGPGPFSVGNPDDAAGFSRPPGSRRSICIARLRRLHGQGHGRGVEPAGDRPWAPS